MLAFNPELVRDQFNALTSHLKQNEGLKLTVKGVSMF